MPRVSGACSCPGAAIPGAAPAPPLFLAAVSFSRRFAERPDLAAAAPWSCSWLGGSPRLSWGRILPVPPHPSAPRCCVALPCPVPARAWALPHVPARVPGSSRVWHRQRQAVPREEEPAPVPLRGQGLPCAASHRRGQEVSGPITMGLCAVSVLLSTDLVQFCTVFSLLGSAEDTRPARPAAAPEGCPSCSPRCSPGREPVPQGLEPSDDQGEMVLGRQAVAVGAKTRLLPPQASLEVSLSQPTRTSSGSER